MSRVCVCVFVCVCLCVCVWLRADQGATHSLIPSHIITFAGVDGLSVSLQLFPLSGFLFCRRPRSIKFPLGFNVLQLLDSLAKPFGLSQTLVFSATQKCVQTYCTCKRAHIYCTLTDLWRCINRHTHWNQTLAEGVQGHGLQPPYIRVWILMCGDR